MKVFVRALSGVIVAMSTLPALSMNLIDASYDAATDQLVFTIAYRGTHAGHSFAVSWETCRTMSDGHLEILGIIQDSDPNDQTKAEFTKTQRVSLEDFSCRPAVVTIGLASPLYRRTLTIPARPN